MEKTSKIAMANPLSGSRRVTIPSEFAQELGLEVGDIVAWRIIEEDGKKCLRLRKINLDR